MLPSKDGEMQAYPPTNSLILSDYGSNVERVARILSQLDVPGFEERMEVVTIRFAKAKDIADLIDSIINSDDRSAKKGGRFSSGIPRFNANTKTSTGYKEAFSVIPDDRTNSLIIVGNNAGIAKIKKLVSQLDFRIRPEDSGGVYVYYVRNRDAKELAETLTGLAEESKKASAEAEKAGAPSSIQPGETSVVGGSPQQIFGGEVMIKADASTNSLLVTASKQDYELVQNLLSKIDVPRDQVYVEAVIMEMTNQDNQNVGVNLYQLGDDPYGIGRVGFRTSPIESLLNLTGDSGLILGFGAGSVKPKLTVGGTTFENIPSLLGFINILKTVVDVNILSTPQILAMDNKKAEIEVGETIPVGTVATQGGNSTSTSIEFKPATIKLAITPHISPGGEAVRLEIAQTISQVSDRPIQAKNLQDSSVVTNDRAITTEVVVGNGDTVVLGGLMSERESDTMKKVPFLGDIPILGWLFKGRERKKEKVNLLIFITPKIVRTFEDSQRLLKQKVGERVDYIKQSANGRDPFGKTMDKMGKQQAISKPLEMDSSPIVPAGENIDESTLQVE
jgi:general secretion pathway protein D